MSEETAGRRAEASHIWDKQAEEWYVEPSWLSRRLFEEERFEGDVCDPCCGGGNMLDGAEAAGLDVIGYDIVDRGCRHLDGLGSFLDRQTRFRNFATNPPFELGQEIAEHAVSLASGKVAMVYPTRRLNAAGAWLKRLPLYRIWYVTPRPSMPPGEEYRRLRAAGKEASGGKQDFAVIVFLNGYEGAAMVSWLHRDKEKQA